MEAMRSSIGQPVCTWLRRTCQMKNPLGVCPNRRRMVVNTVIAEHQRHIDHLLAARQLLQDVQQPRLLASAAEAHAGVAGNERCRVLVLSSSRCAQSARGGGIVRVAIDVGADGLQARVGRVGLVHGQHRQGVQLVEQQARQPAGARIGCAVDSFTTGA